jgi:hypothetical protein
LDNMYKTYTSGTNDSGDTAWIMVSTVFGFFLSPALANLYSEPNKLQ